MDAVSLAGVSSVAQHGVRLLLLFAEKQDWCFLVCFSGSPSYPVAWSSCWCRLCLATSPSWRRLEEFPLLRALRRAIRTWKSGLCLRPRFFQSFGVWVLPLEYVVFSGRVLCLVQQWIHVLREAFGELHMLSPCGELRSEAFTLHSAEWRSVHS